MKKQIITIAAVALAAVILFSVYAIFLKDNGIESVGDEFYALGEEVKSKLAETEEDVEIVLWGYNGADTDWEMIYRFANSVADADKNISVETEASTDGDFKGVSISAEGGKSKIPFEDFFKVRYDGKTYAFDGEALICNGIFSLTGRKESEISLRALEGFDIDGDDVTAKGLPFVFPALERDAISYLTISNKHGEYSIYQANDSFYFSASRAIAYNDEMFALLTTNCRHANAVGKMEMPEGKSWSDFGINNKSDESGKEIIVPSSGYYSLMTETDSDGNYTMHSVYIGDKSSTGQYYFARYIGGIFKPSGKEGVADTLVENISKDMIYFISADTFDGSIALPQTAIMNNKILNPIEDGNELQKIGDIRIDLYKEGVSALAKNMTYYALADNLANADTSESAVKVVGDKVSSNPDYSSYEGAWLNNINVFGGFKVKTGSSSYLTAALARYPKDGKYTVKFGLLRDEGNHAVPPKKFTLQKSYDGLNWHSVEGVSVDVDQSNGTVKNYEMSFEDKAPVKFVRLCFDAPAGDVSFVVFDEIRIYGGSVDLQPTDNFMGSWKLVAPSEFIDEGYNYAYLDMTNFNDFLQSFAQLGGEKVVDCGFSDNGDATPSKLKKDILAKYGLDNPEKHFSFEYKGAITDLYLSAKNEAGKYYAYATLSGEVNGKQVIATTDVIVELSEANTKWLGWDMIEYINHSPVSMYLTDIDKLDVTVDGTEYEFDLGFDEAGGKLASVTCGGKNYDVDSFKNFYESMLVIEMVGEFKPDPSAELKEYLKIEIHSDVKSCEFVFYRIDSSRCYYTVDGVGGYYVLVSDVNVVRNNLQKYLNGEIVTR